MWLRGVTNVTDEVNRPNFERAVLNSGHLCWIVWRKSKNKMGLKRWVRIRYLQMGSAWSKLIRLLVISITMGIIMADLRREKTAHRSQWRTLPSRLELSLPRLPIHKRSIWSPTSDASASRSIGSYRSMAGSYPIASCLRRSAKSPRRQNKSSLSPSKARAPLPRARALIHLGSTRFPITPLIV